MKMPPACPLPDLAARWLNCASDWIRVPCRKAGRDAMSTMPRLRHRLRVLPGSSAGRGASNPRVRSPKRSRGGPIRSFRRATMKGPSHRPPQLPPPRYPPPAPVSDHRQSLASGPLLSESSSEATQAAFNHLAETITRRALGDRPIADITQELLRGMLKQWLDDNLP
ncbi:MAG: DUF2497 domain-containing protein, partial [Alphaproteobacteria bacterium]